MRPVLFLLCAFLAQPVLAEQRPPAAGNLSQEQIGMLMQSALEMQACMKQTDPGIFDRLNQQGYEMQQKISSLCKAGKRDKAMNEAIRYGREVKESKDMKLLEQCTSPATRQFAEGMLDSFSQQKKGKESTHICDHIASVEGMNR